MRKVGYVTGTFDLIHPGHIEFLKTCKNFLGDGGILIVGLTSDDLAIKQKRKTTMSYRQRREILIHFPFVDSVISHTGQSKLDMHDMLKFNILFTGEEYLDTEEYTTMSHVCDIVYIPCPLSREFSSSHLETELLIDRITSISIIKDGVSGLVYKVDSSPVPILFKTVKITNRERLGDRCSNVYNLPIPYPRNLKKLGEPHDYPNIPGVNGYREIDIQHLIKSFPWCDTIDVSKVYDSIPDNSNDADNSDDFTHITKDRSHPSEVYFIYQYYSGENLDTWIHTHQNDTDFLPMLYNITKQILESIDDMRKIGLIHGDIHPENICIKPIRE
jgi:glycerol-3-phosphate cytidylyltransferase